MGPLLLVNPTTTQHNHSTSVFTGVLFICIVQWDACPQLDVSAMRMVTAVLCKRI